MAGGFRYRGEGIDILPVADNQLKRKKPPQPFASAAADFVTRSSFFWLSASSRFFMGLLFSDLLSRKNGFQVA
ncbi:MAG: hypothetical protein DWH82_04080 [Planctomycetota bacterium]|nr:MAG: hypothetical protein DWH82_04080 [Planctomycetota bacterium]